MIGINVDIENTIVNTLNKYDNIDIKQICVKYDELEKEKELVNYKLFYTHLPCNYNNMYDYTIINIQKYIDIMNNMKTRGVLHIGNNNKYGDINRIGENLNKIKNMTKNKILLENAAGQGCDLGYNMEQIRKLYEIIDYNNFGFCLDTQHAYGSGLCNFNTNNDIDKLFEELYNMNKIPNLIHLNDSKIEYGKRIDRHDNIGNGYIWKNDKTTLYRIMDYMLDYNIDIILETPKKNIMTDYINIKNIYEYKKNNK